MARISPKPQPIASFYEKTMTLKLNKKRFKKKFNDGTPITSFEIERMGNKLYFVRRGRDRKGNCRLWRAKVRFTSDGQVIFMRGGVSESCSGNPCEDCHFAPAPEHGCYCVRPTSGLCNHTITRQQLADFGVFLRR